MFRHNRLRFPHEKSAVKKHINFLPHFLKLK
ncbi:hypothetical protein CF65_02213 [Aggregatibacter actinomycetemcomitans HK1651]|nr:hypothetical protein CF65_02213 [Aggregatibacter actinomycetemcomitans HK1651]